MYLGLLVSSMGHADLMFEFGFVILAFELNTQTSRSNKHNARVTNRVQCTSPGRMSLGPMTMIQYQSSSSRFQAQMMIPAKRFMIHGAWSTKTYP